MGPPPVRPRPQVAIVQSRRAPVSGAGSCTHETHLDIGDNGFSALALDADATTIAARAFVGGRSDA